MLRFYSGQALGYGSFMRELSKSIARRRAIPRFLTDYFVGCGVDIGGKPDPLLLYSELFPLMTDVRTWDLEDGDAQFMGNVTDSTFDFVHSSHCLEHLIDPFVGIQNWFRILKPGGHLIITIPDEDLYEQGVWPSTYNLDHKWTFSINKKNSWSPKSINVFELISSLGDEAEVKKIELLDSGYRYSLPRYDQTSTPIGESAIEIIMRKRTTSEIKNSGYRGAQAQPSELVRAYLNQYVDDYHHMKTGNQATKPFMNTQEIK
jgi:SAM-dependent methyltransferase